MEICLDHLQFRLILCIMKRSRIISETFTFIELILGLLYSTFLYICYLYLDFGGNSFEKEAVKLREYFRIIVLLVIKFDGSSD